MKDRKPLTAFVSYSHLDRGWTEKLFSLDYVATTYGHCFVWKDTRIRFGDEWGGEIQTQLENASIAILLVSRNYLASPFINKHELPRLIERQKNDPDFRIVWLNIDIKPEQITGEAQALVAIQGWLADLPAAPDNIPAAELRHAQDSIKRVIQEAVDPIGAELVKLTGARYEVGEFISQGTLSAVYTAEDRTLKRRVAIKALADKRRRDEFNASLKTAVTTSDQPSFVTVYDARMDEHASYCVMQLVENGTLRQRIKDHPKGLPPEMVGKIFRGVAAAIRRAHSLRMACGNIKPSNILLNEYDEPFILPLGECRYAGRVDQPPLQGQLQRAKAGQELSEVEQEDLAYLLPERFSVPDENFSPQKADQYMFGLLVYEMATGRLPDVVDAQKLADGLPAFKPLPSVTDSRRLCPQSLASMIARMTSPRQSDRYPDIDAMLRDARVLENISLSVAMDSYRRCARKPEFEDGFFERFYTEFVGSCDGAQQLFAQFREQDWRRQHGMLKEAILLVVAFQRQNDGVGEPTVLSRIAKAHAKIPQRMFDPFKDALINAICAFDPECDEQLYAGQRDLIRSHWVRATEAGFAYLKRFAL